MKGLSFSQPWLWAVFDPIANKEIENRLGYQAPIEAIGKPLACHAAKSFDDDGLSAMWELGLDTPSEFLKSQILGVATIDRIVSSPKTLTPNQRRWYMGDDQGMRDGKTVFGHVLTERRILPKPIPWGGQLGFWEVPPLIAAEIAYQIDGIVGPPFPVVCGVLDQYIGSTMLERLERFVHVNPGEHLWVVERGRSDAWCFVCANFRPKPTAKKQPACPGLLPLSVRKAAP